jgi:thiol-disulfide isomerase/thioredoxin
MKKYLSTMILAVITLSCSNAQNDKQFSKDALGKNLITPENTKINFSEILKKHKGKVTVIEVWASWCGDCVKSMPKLKKLQENNPEVDYVFISMDKEFEKWQNGVEKHELIGDHYWAEDGMKGEFGKAINLDWIPRYIVLDKNGKVILYRAIETDFETIDTTLKNLK